MMASMSNVELKDVVIAIVSIMIVATAVMNALDSFYSFRQTQQQLRHLLRTNIERKEIQLEKNNIQVYGNRAFTGNLSTECYATVIFTTDRLEMPERNKLMAKLRELSRLPFREKKKTLVYIPKSIELFWKSLRSCRTIPFLVPAITGMAMLDGLPDINCKTQYYGYDIYKKSIRKCPGWVEPESICQKASAVGFSQVIALEETTQGDLIFRKLACSDS